jgi:hypothetical protein
MNGGWIIGWENLVEITTAKLPKCRSHTIHCPSEAEITFQIPLLIFLSCIVIL